MAIFNSELLNYQRVTHRTIVAIFHSYVEVPDEVNHVQYMQEWHTYALN